jgi:Tol biopolymer transport system component
MPRPLPLMATGLVALALVGTAEPAGALPPGAEIAFVRERPKRGVWIVDAVGHERRLTDGQDYGPAWSPDGRWIVLQRFDGGGSDLYAVRANGRGLRALTTEGRNCGSAWSPDGSTIAFASRRLRGNFAIWLVAPDGSGLRRLTAMPARDTGPAWSPHGRSLVFSSERGRRGDEDLYLIQPDGTRMRRLTNNGASDWGADWSADGRSIVFTRSRVTRGQQLLVVIDVPHPCPGAHRDLSDVGALSGLASPSVSRSAAG